MPEISPRILTHVFMSIFWAGIVAIAVAILFDRRKHK
jgi:hypothetical protein